MQIKDYEGRTMEAICKNKKECLIFLLISFYITFSFVGYSIFLPLDKVSVTITDVLIFGVAWCLFSVAMAVLMKGKWLKQGFKKLEVAVWSFREKKKLIKVGIGLNLAFIIYCLVQLVTTKDVLKNIEFYKLYVFLWIVTAGLIRLAIRIWKNKPISVFEQSIFMLMAVVFPVALVCYPGCLSSDSIDQITQCSTLVFSDHHPFLHTFFEKTLLSLINNVMFITVIQVLVYVYVVARWMNYLIKKGIKKSRVFLISAVITLYPGTLSLVVTLWKDALFSIGLLWLSLLMAEYIDDKQQMQRIRYWIEIFFACVFTGTFRHNGALIMLGLIFCVAVLHFINKNAYSWKRTLGFIFCIIIIFAGKTALFNKWNVSPNGSLASIIPIHGIAYEIYMGEELPEEVITYMDGLMPIEQLRKNYHPYSANTYMYDADAMKYGTMAKVRQSDIPEVIGLYLKTLAVNPYYLIKDRLYGTDTMWNVLGGGERIYCGI